MQPSLFEIADFPGYALLDSGGGEKLERFGTVILRRPDPQALWRPQRSAQEWQGAQLVFERESDRGGIFRAHPSAPAWLQAQDPAWEMAYRNITLRIRPTPFKHLGLFPEQASNWNFLQNCLERFGPEPQRVLNLFGYSGAASVLLAKQGAEVIHVDASRSALQWTRENARLSGLGEQALKLLCEDALDYVQRAARRREKFQLLLLDPPHYGRGPKGQKWQLETGLLPLIEACAELLAARAVLVLSTYAVGYSPLAFQNLLAEIQGARVSAGELVLREHNPGAKERCLPCGFCARLVRGADWEV